MQIRALPTAFWLVIFSALIVATTLLVGIYLENTAPEAASFASAESCRAEEMPLRMQGDHRLIGWESDHSVLAFWTLEAGTHFRRSVLTETRDGYEVKTSQERPIFCQTVQGPNCLYPRNSGERVADGELNGSLGWVRLTAPGADDKYILFTRRHEDWTFHNALGLCGSPIEKPRQIFVLGDNETARVLVIASFWLAEYRPGSLGRYSTQEIPAAPSDAYVLGAGGFENLECSSRLEKSAQIRDADVMDGRLLVLGSFPGERTSMLWSIKLIDKGNRVEGIYANEVLNNFDDQVRWLDRDRISLVNFDFFRIYADNLIFEPGKIPESPMRGPYLYRTIPARERREGRPASFARMYFENPRGQKIYLTMNEGPKVPTGLSGVPDQEVRWLFSRRSAEVGLVLLQTAVGERIRAFRITCAEGQRSTSI